MNLIDLQSNLTSQLALYQELLQLAEAKGDLLATAGGNEEPQALREIVRSETLIVSNLEDLERERIRICGGMSAAEIEVKFKEEAAEFSRLRTELKALALRLKERNQLNQSVLKFSLKLVSRMIQAIRDLSSKDELTYSRIRKRVTPQNRQALNLSV